MARTCESRIHFDTFKKAAGDKLKKRAIKAKTKPVGGQNLAERK